MKPQELTSLQRRDDEQIQQGGSTSAMEIASSRVAQEVQAAMVVAKKFPREYAKSIRQIEAACCRPLLASKAQYHFPRGNEEISGISIRLAEVLARAWGNVDFGTIEIEQRDGESLMMAYCWDLESNVRSTRLFVVPHIREKRGRNGLQQIALEGARDIYEMTANMGARRERACILKVIPVDIQEEAVALCNKTLQADFSEEKRDKMVEVFDQKFGVTLEQLEKFVGRRLKKFDGGTYVRLRRVYQTLADGFGKVADFFPPEVDPAGKPRGKFGLNKDKEPAEGQDEKTAAGSAAESTEEPQGGATEGAQQQDKEFLFHCNKCGANFVRAVVKNYRKKPTNHCLCGSRDLRLYEEWKAEQPDPPEDATEDPRQEETEQAEQEAPAGEYICENGHTFEKAADGKCWECGSEVIEKLEA